MGGQATESHKMTTKQDGGCPSLESKDMEKHQLGTQENQHQSRSAQAGPFCRPGVKARFSTAIEPIWDAKNGGKGQGTMPNKVMLPTKSPSLLNWLGQQTRKGRPAPRPGTQKKWSVVMTCKKEKS